MFEKILIANRGEIAVRVIRTARRLGIRTVAVYSEADVNAMHVESADEALCIGPAPASASYLRGDTVLAAARRSGAQAIHPGYGFLSENAQFAAACEAAGIVFIGPPAAAIRAMGSKVESKRLMASAGVPLVPGYHGEEQGLERLTSEAQAIGFPVLVKASAGGGGKGMRIIQSHGELANAVAGAKREAKAAFGDDRLLLEKYLTHTRHVEVQVFADTHGQCVYMFDRDCSVQRRHQKIIEEAPAPDVPEELRERMGQTAVAAARAVNYVGAGTVEFMYASEFYFIEMNTRLQVEHPVTEMITGLDLVEWQLRVAAGEALPLSQRQLTRSGHAIEARIYAEDPARDFLPSIGTLLHLRPPEEGAQIRVDTGVRGGDRISIHYDPMIAKLVVWGADREAAVLRLRRALEDYEVAGVQTNLALLADIARHPAFAAARIDTGFIEQHRDDLLRDDVPGNEIFAVASLAALLRLTTARFNGDDPDPYSPWRLANGWRLNHDDFHEFIWTGKNARRRVLVHFRGADYELELESGARLAVTQLRLRDHTLSAVIDGARIRATVVFEDRELTVLYRGRTARLCRNEPAAGDFDQEVGLGGITAPMPGKVIAILVKEGRAVERGHPLMILEAMKMEHTVVAPAPGIVTELRFAVGDRVSEGDELLKLRNEGS